MSERPTPETNKNCGWALTSHYGRSQGKYLATDKEGPFVHANFARKLERERDEALREAAKWESSFDAMERAGAEQARRANENYDGAERERDEAQQRAKELTELVDGAYVLVELDKPEGSYNKKWREEWLKKAARLVPGCDSIWY